MSIFYKASAENVSSIEVNGISEAYHKDNSGVVVPVYVGEVVPPIPLSDLPVGALVKFKANNAYYVFIVIQQGRPTGSTGNNYYQTWGNSTIVLMKNTYNNQIYRNIQYNYYGNTTLEGWLRSSFYNMLEPSAKSIVANQSNIPYIGSTSPRGVNITPYGKVGVFLLSCTEVGYPTSSNPITEGNLLSYFKYNNSVLRICNSNWWLRSPNVNTETSFFYCIGVSGTITNQLSTSSSGVRPALILNNTALVSGKPDADGAYILQ